jgi:hypothetical protein
MILSEDMIEGSVNNEEHQENTEKHRAITRNSKLSCSLFHANEGPVDGLIKAI